MRINKIETKHLIIRDFIESDAQDLYDIKNDVMIQKNSPDFLAYLPTYEDIKQDLHLRENYVSILGGLDEKYAICLKETDELIGAIEIYETNDFDDVQISWHFSCKFTGNGYASEASIAIVDVLFAKQNLDCICATMDTDNIASYKTAEKSGFKFVGKLEYWRGKNGEVYYYKKENNNVSKEL
jgi:ribosomal-protein-alanine N-acetyltransferase